MLKYLIVQLDDSSTSFCHYECQEDSRNLISIDDLRCGLIWAMKENLMVQFVYPSYELPQEYLKLIDSVDHIDIKANDCDVDVTIVNGLDDLSDEIANSNTPIVLRLKKSEFFENIKRIAKLSEVNVIITDINTITEPEQEAYKNALQFLASAVKERITRRLASHINLLTDRMQLSSMNNCNAGIESVTLAPDGNFYICPGFYFDKEDNVGNPKDGLNIPNQRLFKLEYAPICRKCDAFHCKRCVWLNKKNTLEVNTPSHEQCVISHIERNASRELLESLNSDGLVKSSQAIPEIDYLDPFENIVK